MSSILNNDNFVSVLPRIIDPGMQFTKESIKNSNLKDASETNTSVIKNKSIQVLENKDKPIIPQCPQGNSFLTDYKYVILMIIVSIIIIIIIYFIYKYFDNKSIKDNKSTIKDEIKDEIKILSNEKDKVLDTKKNENVKEYIANYIIDDSNDVDDADDESSIKVIDNNIINNNEEELIKLPITSNIGTSYTPINVAEVVSIDTSLVFDSNINLGKEISNENLESENIEFLVNSINKKEVVNLNNYTKNDGYHSDTNDSDNMNIFEELDDISETESNFESDIVNEIKAVENDELDNDADDDLKYFKKFAQK